VSEPHSSWALRESPRELEGLRATLLRLRQQGKLMLAILYGSFAHGAVHVRSDVDLAIYLNAANEDEELQIIDEILMSSERDVSVLRLDDEDESPFVAQQALRGIHLVEPDPDTLHRVAHRVLHECEAIRFRRMLQRGSS